MTDCSQKMWFDSGLVNFLTFRPLFYFLFHFDIFWHTHTNSLVLLFPSPLYFELIYLNMLKCYMPTFLNINMNLCILSYILIYIYAYFFTCLHKYMPTFLHICINRCLLTSTNAFIHANMIKCLHEYMPTCLHFYVHICLLASSFAFIQANMPMS